MSKIESGKNGMDVEKEPQKYHFWPSPGRTLRNRREKQDWKLKNFDEFSVFRTMVLSAHGDLIGLAQDIL